MGGRGEGTEEEVEGARATAEGVAVGKGMAGEVGREMACMQGEWCNAVSAAELTALQNFEDRAPQLLGCLPVPPPPPVRCESVHAACLHCRKLTVVAGKETYSHSAAGRGRGKAGAGAGAGAGEATGKARGGRARQGKAGQGAVSRQEVLPDDDA